MGRFSEMHIGLQESNPSNGPEFDYSPLHFNPEGDIHMDLDESANIPAEDFDDYVPEQEDYQQTEDYDSDYIQDDWVDTEY